MAANNLTICEALAESWWQTGSQLHMLARMNSPRFAFFDPIVGYWRALHVLDLECGGGLATTCLAQRGARVVGLDLSQTSPTFDWVALAHACAGSSAPWRGVAPLCAFASPLHSPPQPSQLARPSVGHLGVLPSPILRCVSRLR